MATIYRKISAGNANGIDQTLVLDSSEALIYPIAYNDWNELRIAFSLSFTTYDNLNTGSNLEELVHIGGSNRQCFYLGLKDNGNGFPFEPGTVFIGQGFSTGESSIWAGGAAFSIGSSSIPTVGTFGNLMYCNGYANVTSGIFWGGGNPRSAVNYLNVGLPTNYSSLWAFKFNRGFSGSSQYMTTLFGASNTAKSVTDTSSIRGLLKNFTYGNTTDWFSFYSDNNAPFSRFFTTNFQSGAADLTLPNSLFVYFPFTGFRVRIHNIVVDKYS